MDNVSLNQPARFATWPPPGFRRYAGDASLAAARQYATAVDELIHRPRAYRTDDPPPPADVTAVTDGDAVWERVDPDGCKWALRPGSRPGVPLSPEQLAAEDDVERWSELDEGRARLVVDATRPVDWTRRRPRLPAARTPTDVSGGPLGAQVREHLGLGGASAGV